MAADLLSTICAEIEDRLVSLRPALAEYEQLLLAVAALEREQAPAEVKAPRASAPVRPLRSPVSRDGSGARAKTKAPRAARGAARDAILAALDHGSHTVSELAMVTAMSAANIHNNLRRLIAEGTVTKAQREGKTAYALAS